MKLNNHAYANCNVIKTADDEIHFISYTTTVIIIDRNGYLACNGLYSMTTRKQIGWFLKEYAPNLNYHDVKKAYENAYMIHVENGDIIFM